MSKNKIVAITLALIISGALLVGVSSCGREQVVYQQQQPMAQPVYVQHNNQWIEYAMFMSIMNSSGRHYDLDDYRYSTRGTGGNYRPYKPTSSDFTSMKSGRFTGKTMVARPPVAVRQKTNIFGKTTVVQPKTTPTTKTGLFGKKTIVPTSNPKPVAPKKGLFSKFSSSNSSKATTVTPKASSSGKVSSFGGSSSRASSGGFGG